MTALELLRGPCAESPATAGDEGAGPREPDDTAGPRSTLVVGVAGIEPTPAHHPPRSRIRASAAEVPTAPHPEVVTLPEEGTR